MRFSYFVALLLVIALAGVQWYQTTKYICPVPIAYRLGVIDESFTITHDEALAAIASAESVWEEQVAQELFVYDDASAFVINFVFDDRQAMADAQEADKQRLDDIATQNNEFKVQIGALQATYEARQADFAAAKSAYEADLLTYNQRVQQANDRGGAAPALYAELEAQQRVLDALSAQLRSEAAGLNNLAQQLNNISAEGNRLIDTYNQEVRVYNDEYGEQHEFTQGDYQGGEINVYKFSSEEELVSVLAHEFGHALGIGHVEEPGSLMYYLLDEALKAQLQLSEGDIASFAAICADQGLGSRVRASVRAIIAKF